MENQFSDKMAQQTDAQLLVIVNERRADYLSEAILAAEHELASRNLSAEVIDQAIQQNAIEEELRLDRANEPLNGFWKGLAFMFPGILVLMFSGTFKADGYDQKAKEMLTATLYGFGFYVALIIVISIFNR